MKAEKKAEMMHEMKYWRHDAQRWNTSFCECIYYVHEVAQYNWHYIILYIHEYILSVKKEFDMKIPFAYIKCFVI